jgi:hypothetical protein
VNDESIPMLSRDRRERFPSKFDCLEYSHGIPLLVNDVANGR